jgi:uncharacterized membrane protein YphA (DoxX/SURF4 family)
MFGLAALFDGGAASRRVLTAVHEPVVGWFGRSVFGLTGGPNDAGARWALVQQLVAILIAVGVAAVWSVASRRTEYRRLHGWARVILRYYVAVIVLVYGGLKVINLQFPPLTLAQISQPLGNLSPMGLLWTFMGYSPAYTMFAGLGEVVGAFLLFFRRTTTLGALILIGVMSNVALMNYAYDVPVKQLSTNLLLAAMVLVAPDARRLFDVLVRNASSVPADLSVVFPRWLARVRRVVKPLVIVVATVGPLAFSWRLQSLLRRPPLYGLYEVDQFVRNGVVVPPLTTDSTRWRAISFSRPETMAIRLMSDSLRSLSATVDTSAHRITYRSVSGRALRGDFVYEQLATGLRVRGVEQADSIDVTLRRVDVAKAYRLMR